ncbi:helix-turn-helix domain-containing protein [Prescottella subtropica]|uniref:helix-turn-helix domain-containing protein n=1 Tax=Prescottella subtropica TaxID=2545757 RepID=UPI001386A013|nr:helix-turn-helix domain-containing protein [Prescottella subtropica]
MTDLVQIRGTVIDDDTASFLAASLRLLIRVLDEQRRRPVPRVFTLERQLACSAKHSVDVTGQDPVFSAGAVSTTNLLDTETAAKILDCTAENIRALCRRRRLPAQRAGGRWLIPADAVHERAAQRKDIRCPI